MPAGTRTQAESEVNRTGDHSSDCDRTGDHSSDCGADRTRASKLATADNGWTRDFRVRLLALFVLALAGVALAAAGSALGVGDSLGGSEPNAEFTVSEGNVTLSYGGSETTAVENLSGTGEIEIRNIGDQFHVRTGTVDPLNSDERDRALELARSDETIRNALDDADESEVTVEPGRQFAKVTDVGTGLTVYEKDSNTGSDFVEVVTGESDESVTLTRHPSTAETATVSVRDAAGNVQYSVLVDLASEQVVESTG